MPKWSPAIAIWCLVRACLASGPVQSVLTPRFEENAGQSSSDVLFLVRAPGYAAAFDCEARVVYAALPGAADSWLVQMRLLDGASRPTLGGEGDPEAPTMLYRGAVGHSGSRLNNYKSIRYQDVYPGIDWVWHFQEGALEFQFEVDPGANPAAIRMAFTATGGVRLDRDGNLDVDGGAGLHYRRPEAWQDGPMGRVAVPVAFRIDSGIVTFDVGPHDSKLPLTIDPVVTYSRYLGGAGYDAAYAVATDAAGSLYVTGETSSVDFSSSNGVRYNRDAFVSKLSPDGSQVVYTVILSSGGNDAGKAIAIDGGGNVWVAGVAGGFGFPVTSGTLNAHSSGVEDAFVARLDSNGQLKYSTYLGGGGTDVATALAIDPSGSVYVAGYTSSVNFPTTSGAPQTTFQGGTDAFVVKLAAGGAVLAYATLLGGSGNDSFSALSVDAGGSACAAGQTSSSTLPVRNAMQPAYGGNGDAMLACLNPTGTAWNTLTYWGGSGSDEALGIARDGAGNIYLTGNTYSYNFPTTSNAYRKSSAGGYDAFVVKFNSARTAIVFATLLGGSATDSATAVSVDSSGNVWIAGYTASVNFSVTDASGFSGYYDGFLAQISPDGSSLLWAGYLGGSGDDRCYGIVLAATGEPILAGVSGSAGFPVTTGASPTPYNAFVMRFSVSAPPSVGSFTPGSKSGASQSFITTFLDPDGYGDISVVGIEFGRQLSFVGTCYMNYTSSGLWLMNDAGTAWLQPKALGSSGSLQNSQCTIDLSRSSANGNGTTLSISLAMTFTANLGISFQVYASVTDIRGLQDSWRTVGVWSIPDSSRPQTTSVSPSSGTGTKQTFTTTFTDPDGYGDISVVGIEFGRQLSFVGTCYMNYTSSGLWLMNDAGTAWLQPKALGSAGSLQNSQCTIDLSRSSATGNGTALSISLAMTFTANLGTSFQIYASVTDMRGLQDSWRTVGAWGIPASPPHTGSVSPSSGTGTMQTFTATFTDPDGYGDISVVGIEFGRQLSFVGTCYMNYTSSGLWLMNDAGTAWLQPKALGSPGNLQNSQCAIDLSRSSATGNGTTQSISLAMTFSANLGTSFQIYASVADSGGLQDSWRAVGVWSMGDSSPHTTSVSPSSGTGSTQTFTTTFTDPDGYGDISVVGIEFGRQLSFVRTCYMNYTSSGLWLMNDAGTAWLQPKALGSAGSLQNSQCTIDLSRSSATGNGTTQSISLAMTFNANLGTSFQVYASVADSGGLQDSWRAVGVWSMGGSSPHTTSVSPSSGTGTMQTFTTTFTDPDGYGDISVVGIEFGRQLSFVGTCYMNYTSSGLWLMNDAGTAWLQPKALGSPGNLQNSQCAIDLSRSSATGNGTTLSISLAITFTANLGTSLQIYASVADSAGLQDPWRGVGSWIVN